MAKEHKTAFGNAVYDYGREKQAQATMMNPAVHKTYLKYKKISGKGSTHMTYRQFVDYNYPNGAEGD